MKLYFYDTLPSHIAQWELCNDAELYQEFSF